ncbi:MAG TPA: FliH/SctL family protein [Novosphingobium sp.]|nr:FliH/SctL family protein [Novosphingobium sp.]
MRPGPSLPLGALAASSTFISDPRFSDGTPPAEPVRADPASDAWGEGYAAGRAEAEAQAALAAQQSQADQARIELSLAHLDADLQEGLRHKLHATIVALCEATLAPLALDREALARRVAKASEMLARADDDKLLRLHPEDLALVADRLPAGLATEPDPGLERGALRIETSTGGVEDGPAHWRRAIGEALAQC